MKIEANVLNQMSVSVSLAGMDLLVAQVKSEIFSINMSVERNLRCISGLRCPQCGGLRRLLLFQSAASRGARASIVSACGFSCSS